MFGFSRKKQSVPFSKLFQAVSPMDFVTIFNIESAQTKAFILSFCPKRNYIKKVMRLLDIQESSEINLRNRSSFVIREYLNRCQKDIFNLAFLRAVEKEVESMIAENESFHDLRSLRKKLIFKRPKEVQIVQKSEKKIFEDKKQEFAPI
jgi:hypothetical protein